MKRADLIGVLLMGLLWVGSPARGSEGQDEAGLKVRLTEEAVVTMSRPGETRWGYYQFPHMWREPDGRIVVMVHVRPDDDRTMDQPSHFFESRDDGKTWELARGSLRQAYVTLDNGDQIHREPAMFRLNAISLPKPVGTYKSNYGLAYLLYRWQDLDTKLATDCFRIFRRRKGAPEWERLPATIDDPGALCMAINTGVFVPFGDMCCEFHSAPDGSLLYVGYRVRLGDNGKPGRYTGPWLLRSSDGGKTWRYHGSIGYAPDHKADPRADQRLGFTEPTVLLLGRKRAVCVMRTTDGLGQGPMYQCESRDMGRTWGKPHVIANHGVRPRLLKLGNGVTVLSSGRPGVQLRFSTDDGETWNKPVAVIEGRGSAIHEHSCGYTYLLAAGHDQLLITYSDFKYRDENGGTRKAVLVRKLFIQR